MRTDKRPIQAAVGDWRGGVTRARASCGCWMACGRSGRGGRAAKRCGATHVLCPSWSVPRRRDGAEVVGEALALAARGEGHRRIACRLDRPPGMVRGWLRAARARAESLRACATRWAVSLDRELVAVTPAGSELGDVVEAITLARPRPGAAVRSRAHRPVGAGGVADRRAAVRPDDAAAVAVPRGRAHARPHRYPAARGGCGSSAPAAPGCPPPASHGA